ncbi:MAG: acyl-CoA desaturase [Gammaproteobacteria bacterium]|nr:acyl-CoA desaturase [Gammaproteobacteria bacterium]
MNLDKSPGLAPDDGASLSIAALSGVVLFHLLAGLVFFAGFSPVALVVCLALLVVRALGITAGYHRYFSHRAFKTNRPVQFLLALLGTLAAQGSLFWWVSHHRDHHKYSDTDADLHSPVAHGFWKGHIGWLFAKRSLDRGGATVADLEKFPELRFLDRFYWPIVFMQGVVIYFFGAWLAATFPGLGTSAFQILVWGYFLSSVLLLHNTFFVNSLTHLWGSRPYNTRDNSRNNALVGITAMGEGWHNNHHRFAYSARLGLKWWQIDVTWYLLWTMQKLGLIWDVRLPRVNDTQAA